MAKTQLKKAADDVHRLSDIHVEEVSLVDRPANKRKFLVVKRSDAMPVEVTRTKDGSYTTSQPGGAPAPAPQAPAAGAKPAAEGDTPTAKAGVSLTKEMKAAFEEVLASAMEGLEAAKGLVESATEVDDVAKAEVDPVVMALGDVHDLLMDTLEGVSEFMASAQDAGTGATPENAGEPDPKQARDGSPLAKVLELVRAQGIVKRAQLQKFGRKISRARLATLETTLSTLSSLVEELRAPNAKGKAEAAPPAGDKAPPGAPPKKKPGEKDPPPAAEKAEGAEKAELTKARETIAKLESLVRQVGAAPPSATRGSNAIPVEDPRVAGGGDFSWPLDMNDQHTPGADTKFG